MARKNLSEEKRQLNTGGTKGMSAAQLGENDARQAAGQVEFQGVWKLFGSTPAVRDLNLHVKGGEFLVLVGPSGCGKTTTLRMLGGLEVPSYGRIVIDDEDVTLWPPGRRDIAMVFQSYALYPHMSVYRNLAFGPKVRHESRADLRSRITEVAQTLDIESLLSRRPSQLSGGQRQRVALGRALIRQPRLFLLDEPLSNLDAALRVQMRAELVRLHNRLKVTTVYVTHDQVEALTMGDRVAVFDQGRLLQIGTPRQLYDEPTNVFVARFIGSPTINMLPGQIVTAERRRAVVRSLGATFVVEGQDLLPSRSNVVSLGLRPHDLYPRAEGPGRCTNQVAGVVQVVEDAGTEVFVEILTSSDVRLMARMHRASHVATGDRLELAFDPADLHMFDIETGERILVRGAVNDRHGAKRDDPASRTAGSDAGTHCVPGTGGEPSTTLQGTRVPDPETGRANDSPNMTLTEHAAAPSRAIKYRRDPCRATGHSA